MTEKGTEQERTELYEREMKHDEHRETPPETAGREARERSGEDEEPGREREPQEKD